ncbi:TlpA family protein disulfide reductase [Geodermatophilus chilensis]|jgi:cytochrome c biogenesis protein CcmG/thiol:disulfide interchange protein DsbE|uniref:TlpA family protein disulfide reductase n=1 Tax=Geodermatophilus chilensis TaxID=2035835 RepID=UPI000C25C24D|nr:TlpA disulfide reductase family protein [Geodermatophilus chilensis]
MSTRTRTAAGLLALGFALVGCTSGATDEPGGTAASPAPDPLATLAPCPEQPDRAAVGDQTLPALALPCPGGGSLDLGRAPGVPTVVNLWASWCGPCREELPLVQQLADVAGDRLSVVGVISRDGAPQAGSFAADAGATFPSAFDGEGELMAELGLGALPYTYLLDADGGIAHVQVGPVADLAELEGLVAEHLGVTL